MIHVIFYKKVHHFFGETEMVKVEFNYLGDDYNAAYEEALKRGHNPNKNIKMRYYPSE
jgi:hypothetical protein